jgi:hypothetical protein
VVPDIALSGVIVDGQSDLQAALIINVGVSGNKCSVAIMVWDGLAKLDRVWQVAAHAASF